MTNRSPGRCSTVAVWHLTPAVMKVKKVTTFHEKGCVESKEYTKEWENNRLAFIELFISSKYATTLSPGNAGTKSDLGSLVVSTSNVYRSINTGYAECISDDSRNLILWQCPHHLLKVLYAKPEIPVALLLYASYADHEWPTELYRIHDCQPHRLLLGRLFKNNCAILRYSRMMAPCIIIL